jgi:hypothetical protein
MKFALQTLETELIYRDIKVISFKLYELDLTPGR